MKMTDIMKNCECCRLGLVDKNEAYIVPMNFGIEIIGEQVILYFHCANQGRKIELISGQTITSFEMDTKHQLIKGKQGVIFLTYINALWERENCRSFQIGMKKLWITEDNGSLYK